MYLEELLLIAFLYSVNSQEPVVEIDTGFITGRAVDYKDEQAFAFYSIPFAKPPVGPLRFKAPEQPEKWNGTKDVSAAKPKSCYQIIDKVFGDFEGATRWNPVTEMSEDCLYLSVYTPANMVKDAAVLVWIYGGGFNSGSISLPFYDGRALAVKHGVIVVAMNYRVGPLGFLYMDDDEIPGNMGLMDQNLALDWVQRNIQVFGGNPEKVTLFGESAGAVSVGLHLLHRRSWDKFDKAILQSGSMNLPYVQSPEEAVSTARLTREKLGCPEGNVSDEVECLRNADAAKLTEEQVPTWPVVDGKWIKEEPVSMMAEGRFKKCSILTGVNKNEGSYFLLYEIPDLTDLDGFQMNRDQVKSSIRELFATYRDYPNITHSSSTAIAAMEDRLTYWHDPSNEAENYRLFEEGYGLRNFTCPMKEMQNAYAREGQDVYAYHFTHRSVESEWPEYVGVMHGDELFYVFGDPFIRDHLYDDRDRNVSSAMMNLWAQFAKTGQPEGWWAAYTEVDQNYLEISNEFLSDPSSAVGIGLHADGCHFWNELLPVLNQEGYCIVAGASSVQLNIYMAAAIIFFTLKKFH